MKRTVGLLAVLALVLAGAACSSSSSPAETSSDTHTSTDTGTTDTGTSDTGTSDTGSSDTGDTGDTGDSGTRSLSDQLVRAKDLEKGWKAGHIQTGTDSGDSSDSSDGTPPCLRAFNDVAKPDDEAKVELKHGATGVPTLSENIGAFGDTAKSTFDELDRSLGECTDISFTDDTGAVLTGTIEPLDIGSYGDDSTAYSLSLTSKGVTAGVDVALIRKGDNLAFLVYADLNKADKTKFKAINKAAAAQLA